MCVYKGMCSFILIKAFLINYLFISGCAESLLLCLVFLQLQWAGATFCLRAQASHGSGFSCRGPRALSVGLQLLWPRLSCSKACAIFPNQGSNLCPPHWLVDSQPLDHQEVPIVKDTSQGYLLEIRVLTFSEGCFHFKKNFQTPVLLCCVQRLVSL